MLNRFSVSAIALALVTCVQIGCDSKNKDTESSNAPPPPPPRQARTLEELGELCKGGEPFPGAPELAKEGADPSKVVMFTQWSKDEEYGLRPVENLEPWSPKRPSEVSIVVCRTTEKKALSHVCPMQSTSGTKIELEMRDTANTVRVLSAKTGKELTKQEFELLGNQECPTSILESSWYTADAINHVVAMVKALQPKDAPAPKPRSTLSQVCSGVPLPDAAPYSKGDKSPLSMSYRIEGEGFAIVSPKPTELYDAVLVGDGQGGEVQLALCITGKPEKKDRDCKFGGGKTVEIHDGTYEVVIREALTGKVVESKTFAAKGGRCPTLHNFKGGEDVAVVLAAPEPGLRKYLQALYDPS